ncbi:MAG: DNA gyrase subunit A [Candidatus Shapirobacteria bacterium]
MTNNIGQINKTEIVHEMRKVYLDYAMSVIVARALPDVRDGLKPVHRRILYTMNGMGLNHGARYSKSAKVVGETLGKYHPHGDAALYDTMVRLAQDFSLRYPLVDGHGNFGSIDGDMPAAMRYTEVRLTKIASEMLTDIDKGTVDYADNFDSTLKEPLYLPAKLPNLLLMGGDGIAVGMATKIPPHNLNEVVEALTHLIEKGRIVVPGSPKSDEFKITKIRLDGDELAAAAMKNSFASAVTIEELVQFIKGPDFPTGATIYNQKEILQAYTTGNGKILMRAVAKIEEEKNGSFKIVITEIPYQVNKAKLVAKIADLVKEKKIDSVADLRDESDQHGMRIVLDLKKTARPKALLNNLYKHTQMQFNYPVNMVALVDGVPQLLNLKQILVEFVKHRQQVVTRRTVFDLEAAKMRAHILEGLKIALDNLDEVINTIRKSADAEKAKVNLMTKFGLSEIQASAILEMQLRRLAALERQKIEDEYQDIKKQVEYLTGLLIAPKKILKIIEEELAEIKTKYGDARRTRVYKQGLGNFSEEDLIPNLNTLVVLTKRGYVKRLSAESYKIQQRGGKGVTGMATKESDEILHCLNAKTHDNVLFFTNKGRVFSIRVWEIAEGTRISRGQAVVNLIDIDGDEQIQAILNLSGDQMKNTKQLFMVTRKGTVKKTELDKFTSIRSSGLIAIKLDKDDELSWVKPTTGEDQILLVSREGKSIRFKESDVRSMGRDTTGVRGIKLKEKDTVVGMEVLTPQNEAEILIITENGLGKRTAAKKFPLQSRGGSGVKAGKITPKTGKIVMSQLITPEMKQVIITTKRAQVIKTPLGSIPKLGRDTQGVILMRFSKSGDKVAAATFL